MTAVLIHESAHVMQTPTYGARISRLSAANNLPDDFNDDSMQRRFESDAAFAASIARETELFREVAVAPTREEALRLAREARALMRARADRYFVGADAYYREAEDVWLTMEGSGQWLGYSWMVSFHGGDVPGREARPGFAQRGRWWSQTQGFALIDALNRLTNGRWTDDVFGPGERTALEIMDAALAAPT